MGQNWLVQLVNLCCVAGETVPSDFQWEGILLTFFAGQCAIPHHRSGLLTYHGLLVDPAGNQLDNCQTLQATAAPLTLGTSHCRPRLSSLFGRPLHWTHWGPLHEFTGLFPSPGVLFKWGGASTGIHQPLHRATSLCPSNGPLLEVTGLYRSSLACLYRSSLASSLWPLYRFTSLYPS